MNADGWRARLAPFVQVGLMSGVAGVVLVLQDALLASRFSTGIAVDVYQLAISVPQTALNVFAGGTLLAVLVPRLAQAQLDGRTSVPALLAIVRRRLGVLLAGLSMLWLLLFPLVASALRRADPPGTTELGWRLLVCLSPVLVLTGLTGVDAAVLNSRRRFGLISLLPLFNPLGVVLLVFLAAGRIGIYAAALGLTAGSVAQWLLLRAVVGRAGDAIGTAGPPSREVLAGLDRQYLTAAASAALLGGIPLTDTFVASTLAPGSTATLGYASRPVILLLAFATTTVGNVLLPHVSHLAARGELAAVRRQFLTWSAVLLAASVPAVAVWWFFAPDLVRLLYERGAFTAQETVRVAAAQRLYVLQMPVYLVAMVGWRVMNSLQRHGTLLAITATAFLANLGIDTWLAPRMGLAGVIWGTIVAFTLWGGLTVSSLLRHGRPPAGAPQGLGS
ncbi:MAG: lipid II flippase MurJ [Vicinamibacterales bacterium]